MSSGERYVAFAYGVFLLAELVYVVIIGLKLARFERDVEELGLVPGVPLPVLSYAVVRLGESFLYSDVMVSREPDLAAAATVCDALVTGVLGVRAG